MQHYQKGWMEGCGDVVQFWYLACVKPNGTKGKMQQGTHSSSYLYWRKQTRCAETSQDSGGSWCSHRDLIYKLYTIATHILQCFWYSDSCFPVSDAGLSPVGLWPGCSSSYPALLMECLSNWQEKWSEATVSILIWFQKSCPIFTNLQALKPKGDIFIQSNSEQYLIKNEKHLCHFVLAWNSHFC